jgi:hypothetical protein
MLLKQPQQMASGHNHVFEQPGFLELRYLNYTSEPIMLLVREETSKL